MLEDFLAYLEGVRKASPHTRRAYAEDLRGWQRFCQEFHGFDPLASPQAWRAARPEQIWAWLSRFEKPTTRARKVAALRRFDAYLRKVLNQPGLKHLPTTPRQPQRLPIPLPAHQLQAELTALAKDPPSFATLRDRLTLELLYGCGLRRSEVVALRLDQVHLSRRELHLMGKGGRWRIVPLYPLLVELLSAYLPLRQVLAPNHPYLLCTDKGRPFYPEAVYRLVRRYLGTHPHRLRHSFATHLVQNGANVQAVRDLLGHSSLATTQKYLAITPTDLRKAYDKYHPHA
ncbi:MAG: tyrosine-type recombinase/integrase [Bacteroidia bacterium]